jgi:hypothetical protein
MNNPYGTSQSNAALFLGLTFSSFHIFRVNPQLTGCEEEWRKILNNKKMMIAAPPSIKKRGSSQSS